MAYDFDLFVIGGGSAGTRLGRISAGHGARVGVAEERFWGGTCVNVGCVPKKLMVIAAEYGFGVEDARGFGWEAHLGEHDWAHFIEAKNREISRLNGIYRRLLDNAGATVFETRAVLEDAHTIRVGDRRVTAERIAIATGGRPTPLDIPGADLAIVSDDAFHLPDRPGHVAIVGSGYIAVEFAGIFAGLGSKVDLIYRADLPLRGFDTDLRQESEAALAANGITLHPGSRPVSIEARGERRLLTLDNGAKIEADHVFFATGRAPNVEGLGLDQAGIATAQNGAIHVDDGLATSVPHIFALGDVTDRMNLTPVATAQGHALADTLFGGKPRRISLQNVPSAVFTIPPLATVGLTETDAAAHGEAQIFISRFSPMRHTLSGRQRRTMMKLVVDVASDRVIGAHMFGEESPEIIQGLAVAIQAGATKADFDRTIGIHPTSAEEFVTLRQETRRAGGKSAAAAE